ncbi:MAG: N-acetylmuramic acid 6-phosphate etherase [Candidatus Eremiobacteraeota bacterium]|nr:N-acetylmuramic acid 6-phosphate etherase [Candidatus Eremiobacteraeota bacterium]
MPNPQDERRVNDLPHTEAINERTRDMDLLPTADLVELLIHEQDEAIAAVAAARREIADVVDIVAARLRSGARLHYVGAGTSGRLGFLDASECPPTFGTPPEMVCAHIAGGSGAIVSAVEGAEDDRAAGAAEMRAHAGPNDVVIALSASGSAPFVVGALTSAKERGAWTVAVTHDARTDVAQAADATIVLRTGAEPLAGSTRLRAGTAQKVLLNAISTATMIRLNKVYDNLMIDVVATNQKLRRRALRLVMQLTDLDERGASELLEQAGGSVKVAAVMRRRNVSRKEAQACLEAVGGSLRRAL